MTKTILTDADGVLLDWIQGFVAWMHDHDHVLPPDTVFHYNIAKWYGITNELAKQYTIQFNASNKIRNLYPYIDALEYVPRLYNLAYRFVVISAIGTTQSCYDNRRFNLEHVFGPIFDDVLLVDNGASKKELLKKFNPAIWVEDHPHNAEDGHALGHKTFLIDHQHNENVEVDHGIVRVSKWQQIYEQLEG